MGIREKPFRTGITIRAKFPRRPLVFVTASYASGIACCYFFAPAFSGLAIGLAAGAVLTIASFRSGIRQQTDGAAAAHVPSARLFALFLCCVFFTGALCAHLAFTRADPLEAYIGAGRGEVPEVSGYVLTFEQKSDDCRMMTVFAQGRKLLLRVYGPADTQPAPTELVGRRIVFSGEPSYPDTARNPRCFDYRLHLLSKNIRLIVTADAADVRLDDGRAADGSLDAPGSGFGARVRRGRNPIADLYNLAFRAKSAFRAVVQAALPEEQAALFEGMMFGDKKDIDDDVYAQFQRGGVAHILSVSGLHVGMVYAFVSAALGNKRTKRFYLTALLLLLFYMVLSEFSPSVVRAVMMIAVHIASKLLHRRYDLLTGVCFAALLSLSANPLALFGVGFRLSFTAVISLAFALPFLARFTGFRNTATGRTIAAHDLRRVYGVPPAKLLGAYVCGALLPLLAIQIFMLPLTAYDFNLISLSALALNIPVIALASLIVPFGIVLLVLSCAAAAAPPFAPFAEPLLGVGAQAAGCMIELMLRLTQAADAVPFASFTVCSPPLPLILLFYALSFFLLSENFSLSRSKRRVRNRGESAALIPSCPPALPLAPILFCCLILFVSPVCRQDRAAYTFVDVGQGDCLHIRTADGRNYLMDGGGKVPWDGSDFAVGKETLLPYLLKNGVSHLDGVFISHLHADHFKGLAELSRYMDVGPLYLYEGSAAGDPPGHFASIIAGWDLPLCADWTAPRLISAGDRVVLGKNAAAEILFPPARTETEYLAAMQHGEDENRSSLLIRFEVEGLSVLMTGDVGEEGEAEALRGGADLAADILKVGHHGSKTSTSDAFLDGIAPAAAVIQVGKNNYGHPAPDILAKLRGRDMIVYRNDRDGALLADAAAGGFVMRTVKRDCVSGMLLKDCEKALFREELP
ncbi:MAG: DNA internalization-related competence protein ComEC/Rec2 [Clostridiales Family XIII bacterium]|jgi:competence protein ComEC|nr:DNA internalization-related competence protein ComEC/Rec2 [Clostridiales Family XIII bacterium]